jgi:hypothetical protein
MQAFLSRAPSRATGRPATTEIALLAIGGHQ